MPNSFEYLEGERFQKLAMYSLEFFEDILDFEERDYLFSGIKLDVQNLLNFLPDIASFNLLRKSTTYSVNSREQMRSGILLEHILDWKVALAKNIVTILYDLQVNQGKSQPID
jgi:hypothetical protein